MVHDDLGEDATLDLSSSSGLMQTVAETGKIFIDQVFLAPTPLFSMFFIGLGGWDGHQQRRNPPRAGQGKYNVSQLFVF